MMQLIGRTKSSPYKGDTCWSRIPGLQAKSKLNDHEFAFIISVTVWRKQELQKPGHSQGD